MLEDVAQIAQIDEVMQENTVLNTFSLSAASSFCLYTLPPLRRGVITCHAMNLGGWL